MKSAPFKMFYIVMHSCLTALVIIAFPFAGSAQSEQERIAAGVQKYERGWTKDAFQLLDPLKKSKAFSADAALALGSIYANGEANVKANYDEAMSLLKKAVKDGSTDALAKIGMMYHYGYGVKKNDKTALNYYREAAEKGSKVGQAIVGIAYAEGDGVPQDYAEAVKWFRLSAAQQDYDWGTFQLANMYRDGKGVEKNIPEAIRLYLRNVKKASEEKWATQGWGLRQLRELGYSEKTGMPLTVDNAQEAGLTYSREGNWSMAYQMLSRAASTGALSAEAARWLGYLFDTGSGTEQDYVQAAKWYRMSADAGDMIALYDLGLLYHAGRGVKQDYSEALKWYLKSAALGYAQAQSNAGSFYEYGNGVAQNYTEALKWLQLAVAQGNDMAEYNLAMAYRNGWGVARDEARSQTLLGLSAAKGNAHAAALYIPPEVAKPTERYQQQTDNQKHYKTLCSCCRGAGYTEVYTPSKSYQYFDRYGNKQFSPSSMLRISCKCCGGSGVSVR